MKNSNLITVSVSAAVLLLSVQSAAAQVCTVPPTCDALGYTKSAAECGSNPMLKCPLDQSKVFCHSTTTPSNEYAYSCGSGGYLRITDFSKIINNCASNEAITTVGAIFFCEASLTNISNISGIDFGVDAVACQGAYNLAKKTNIAGCCDYSGKIKVFFPRPNSDGNVIVN